MGHNICVLVVAERVDAERARSRGLHALGTHGHVTVFPIDHHYSEFWARIHRNAAHLDVPADLPPVFPREAVLGDIVREVTGVPEPRFAIALTDYFGGAGGQWAVAFAGQRRLTGPGASINAALAAIGVQAAHPADEFDTIGLGGTRSNPGHLDWYAEQPDPVIAEFDFEGHRIGFERGPRAQWTNFRVLVDDDPVPMTLTKVETHVGNLGTKTREREAPHPVPWISWDGPEGEIEKDESPYARRGPREIGFKLPFPSTEIYNTVIWRSVTLTLGFDEAWSRVNVHWHDYVDDST